MNHFNIKIIIKFSLSIALFFLLFQPVQAKINQIELEVSPAVIFLSVQPGNKITHTISLKQNGTTPLLVTPSLVDFKADGESGNPILQENSQVNFISVVNPDLDFDQPFLLAPNQEKQFVLNIQPPTNLAEKEFPLTILFRAEKQENVTTGTKAISSAIIGSNLILHNSLEAKTTAGIEVEKIQVAKFFDSFRPLNFKILLKNKNINASPVSGQIRIIDWKNKELANFDLVPDIILGNNTRLARYEVNPKKETGDEKNLSTNFVYDTPFLFGPYLIEVTINDPINNIEQSYILRAHTVAFPIAIGLAIIFILNTYLVYRYLVTR